MYICLYVCMYLLHIYIYIILGGSVGRLLSIQQFGWVEMTFRLFLRTIARCRSAGTCKTEQFSWTNMQVLVVAVFLKT